MRTKTLLLPAVLLCLTCASKAQINTGKYLLGGAVGMYNAKNYQPTDDSKFKSFYSNIQFGKAVKENTIVGLTASCSYYNSYTSASFIDTSKNMQYTLGVFYRKYKRIANKFYFFGEADAAYAYAKSTLNYNQGRFRSVSNGGLASFVPGISYAVCRNMQIELLMTNIISVSYSYIRTDNNSAPSSPPSSKKGNVFSFNTNLNSNLLSNFGVGFKFLLGK